jgi:hypothetical protein
MENFDNFNRFAAIGSGGYRNNYTGVLTIAKSAATVVDQ